MLGDQLLAGHSEGRQIGRDGIELGPSCFEGQRLDDEIAFEELGLELGDVDPDGIALPLCRRTPAERVVILVAAMDRRIEQPQLLLGAPNRGVGIGEVPQVGPILLTRSTESAGASR